jgi:FlaA1/EpsC-like NDP-sugar epimerase
MFAGELQKQKALFAAVDCAALIAAFALALALHDPRYSTEHRLVHSDPLLLAIGMVGIGASWILVFHFVDLYRMRNGGVREQIAIVKACTIAVLLTLLALFLVHAHNLPRLTVLLAYLMSIPFVALGRSATRACRGACMRSQGLRYPW